MRGGGLIAYPTDSCYALGWHLGDKRALERVRRIRQADRHHHFTLVCASLADIGRFARIDSYLDGRPRVGLSLATTVDRRDFGLDWQAELPGGGEALDWQVEIAVELQLVEEGE